MTTISLDEGSVAVRGQTMHIAATYPEEASTVSWDFGESGALAGPHIQHIYTQARDYQAELTVVDPDGNRTVIKRNLPITQTAIQIDPKDSNLTALAVGGTTNNDQIVINKNGNNGEVNALLDWPFFRPVLADGPAAGLWSSW